MRRKSGGCAVKECVLTRGYLALCLKGQRGNTERKGEALPDVTSDETGLPRRESEGAGRGLLEQVFARENMQRAWKRVKANKGAAGRHPETGRKWTGTAAPWRESLGCGIRGGPEPSLVA